MALVHPLVRDASIGRLNPDQDAGTTLVQIAASLAEAAALAPETGIPENPPTLPMWQALAPHAFFLRAAIQTLPAIDSSAKAKAATAACFAARMLAAQGRYGQAEQEYRSVLAAQLEVLGERHPNTLITRREIARMLAKQGRHGQAGQE